jgi:hypothetical protein
VTDSTLKPIVGIVVTTSPIYSSSASPSPRSLQRRRTFNRYNSVVFPALSYFAIALVNSSGKQKMKGWNTRPRINILISFFDHSSPDNHDTLVPIFAAQLSFPSTQELKAAPFPLHQIPFSRVSLKDEFWKLRRCCEYSFT